MSGGFSSLNTALSALRYNRVAMDVAGANIANVSTEGYARRRVEGAAVAGPTQPALWSRYDGAGDGVTVTGVTRMTDELLNVRGRREHGNQAYLDVRQASLERIENGLGEPGDSGVAAALADLRNCLARADAQPEQRVRAGPGALQRAQRRRRDRRPGPQRRVRGGRPARARAQRRHRGEHPGPAGWPTPTGPSPPAASNGSDVGVLLDKRDQLTLRLAELTGAKATVRSDGGADVTVERRTPRHRQPGRQPDRRLRA